MEQKQKEISRTADKDFVKLYRRAFAPMAELACENATALKILLFLIRNMDGNNALSISQQVLAKYVGLSRQTVSKQLKYLEATGWIQTAKAGRNTVYIVNNSMAWTSYAWQHVNCKYVETLKGSRLMFEDPWAASKAVERSHVRRME